MALCLFVIIAIVVYKCFSYFINFVCLSCRAICRWLVQLQIICMCNINFLDLEAFYWLFQNLNYGETAQ